MNVRLVSLLALTLGVALFCGCAGYFNYHPVKSTEQEKARVVGESLFASETLEAPVAPAISAEPIQEDVFIK